MTTMMKSMMAVGVSLAMLVPAMAGAAPRKFITAASAKTVVKQVVRDQQWGRNFKWKVTLNNSVRGIGLKGFTAKVNWGKGPHIMIAVPTFTGVVDMNKMAWSPKGKARVTQIDIDRNF